jgi:hypothetical protein
MTERWKGGEQVTIVFQPGEPTSGQPPNSGDVQAFFEKDSASDSSAIQPVAGKAVLGTVNLGLFPSNPGVCTGTPAIGPATINAAAGSRTLVHAYGPDKQNIKLLVLPVAS